MSKKLLKESTIRRFGQLANMKAETVSNFIGRSDSVVAEEEEEEGELALDAEEDEFALDTPEDELALDVPEDELALEPDLDGIAAEEPGNLEMAEKAILAVADALGVPVSIEGGAPAMGDELDLDADLGAEEDLALDADLGAEEDELDLDADLGALEEVTDDAAEEVNEEEEPEEVDDALVQEIIRRVRKRLSSLSKD